MIDHKVSIIYLAHGPKHLHRQCIFSLLTLSYRLNHDFSNINLVVYTDDQTIFEHHLPQLPIKFELLNREQIKSWIRNDYVHRVKICVIQHCMEKYGTDIFFVDGDTYFLQSPAGLINKISPEYTVFHSFEFTIADGGSQHEIPMWLVLRKLARDYEYFLAGEKFKISFDSEMWNSGIFGLSREYYSLIEQVLDLNDQITGNAKFKTAEQFSFAYVLKNYSKFLTGEDIVYHYFLPQGKQLFNYHIPKFLKQYEGKDLALKSSKAVELSLRHKELSVPEKTVFERMKLRCELIWKVARYGHL